MAGLVALSGALGVHFVVGYTDGWHLGAPLVAASSLVIGGVLQHPGFRPQTPAAAG